MRFGVLGLEPSAGTERDQVADVFLGRGRGEDALQARHHPVGPGRPIVETIAALDHCCTSLAAIASESRRMAAANWRRYSAQSSSPLQAPMRWTLGP